MSAKGAKGPCQTLLVTTLWIVLLFSAHAADELRASRTVTLHTVVPTECTMYFSWQSLGIFYSHTKAGQDGPITRIISCTDEQKQTYKDIDLVPSHIVPSLTVDKVHNDVYSAYNKPGAVMYWLQDVKPQEDFILVIDADMIMRQPFDPVALGAGPGWAISAYFTYMKGVSNELAMRHVPQVKPRDDSLAGPVGRRGDQVGGFTLMNTHDLARVAPMWLSFTTAVRNDPTAWNTTGDSYSVNPGDKPWISEMYGYSYACAAADVWHKVDFSAMLYPAYYVASPPKVLHYGLIYTIANTSYTFDKHWHYDFDATACPPWDMSTDHPKKGLFPHPPRASSFKTKGEELLRDLLSIQVIVELNVAFCERHLTQCSPSEQLTKECTYAKELEQEMDAAMIDVEYQITVDSCQDHDKRCKDWAHSGECDSNPGFMINNCKAACKKCTMPYKPRPKLSPSSKPASLTISNPVTVGSITSKLQQHHSDTTDTVTGVLNKGSEAAAGAVVAGQKVLSQGKEAAGAAAEKAAGVVKAGQNVLSQGKEVAGAAADKVTGAVAAGGQVLSQGKEAAGAAADKAAVLTEGIVNTGSEAANKASDALTESAKGVAKTGSDLASGTRLNAAAAKDSVTNGVQSNPVRHQAGKVVSGASNGLLQAVQSAVNASKGISEEDSLKTGVRKKYDTAQFQEAAQQRDADDIADVLDVQAADAEDAQVDEELAQSELGDALGIDSTNSDSLSKDSIKQAATTGLQAASDAVSQAGQLVGAVTTAQAGGRAAGKTKDAHEADLDLTHMDKPPVLDDSIQADSIAKSDNTQASGKDATDSASDKAQSAIKAGANALTDKQGILQQQKDAVASSLEHVQDSAVTTSKRITDPEQEFQQGSGEDANKQPGSRSQKLELGKGRDSTVTKRVAPRTPFFSRLVGRKISRRAIVIGVMLWILSVLGFLTILKLPRAQNIRRRPILRRKGQPVRQH